MFLGGCFRLAVQHRENFVALALINFSIAALLVPPVREYMAAKFRIKPGPFITCFLVISLLLLHDLIPHKVVGLRGPLAGTIIETLRLPDADEDAINRARFSCNAIERSLPHNETLSRQFIARCIVLTLRNKGYESPIKDDVSTYKKEEISQIEQAVNAAALLQHNANAGDVRALIELRAAQPETNMEEFLRVFYETNGITIPSADDFPVTFYEKEIVPLPKQGSSGVTWTDNHTLQYVISDNPTGLGKDEKNLRVVEVDLSANPIKVITLPANTGTELDVRKDSAMSQSGPFKECAKLQSGDGYACIQELYLDDHGADAGRPNGLLKEWAIVHRDDKGTKKNTFKFPVHVSPFNIKFDPYSNTYWMQPDQMRAEKIVRFDRDFKKMSEETYPEKLWGGHFNSGVSFFGHHFTYEEPFLKQVVKNGFVVGKAVEISDYNDLGNSRSKPKLLFRKDAIFLVLKDGRAFKLVEVPHFKEEYMSSDDELFSVSPDGCKVLFLQLEERTKRPPEGISFTMYFGRTGKVGIVDVCSYFSKKT